MKFSREEHYSWLVRQLNGAGEKAKGKRMIDWFRSWHGAPTDTKWLGVARKAGVAPGVAVAVAWALMDRASCADDRGSIEGYDAEGLAYFFGWEPEQVTAVVSAMIDKGMIENNRFTSWEKRQPKREDPKAADRAKTWRDKNKTIKTERNRTQPNATERNRTQPNATERNRTTEKSRVDKIREEDKGFPPPVREREEAGTQDDFDAFWQAYPHKVQQPSARGAYPFACIKASPAEILAGAVRYARKTDDRPWMNPAKWLAEECWNDQPAQPPPKQGASSRTEQAGQRFLNRGQANETDNQASDLRNVLQLSALKGS